MRVLVVGSRSFDNAELVRDRLSEFDVNTTTIISGGARGADRIAAQVATELGLNVVEVRADWERYGKSAGFKRNNEMLDLLPHLVIAYWDGHSRGTKHTIDGARSRQIPVEVVQ